jgi:hypothetical protein
LTFFSLSGDPNTSSLNDNKLKSEINNIRSTLTSTNYKTKLVVILLGDGPIAPPDLDDRFNTIRRATGLDAKGIFFLPHDSSSVEITDFVNSVLASIHPLCVEYYRDLSKHCRRKRNRNVVPQPTVSPATSHVLPLQGWNVRYEFKLGVFAEFRQEMDAACRNYEAAYDGLFASEIIDAVAVWSPRFNEARLLADAIALRIIRVHLWTDQIATAVRFWITHKDRVRSLVDRRAKGTANYGWEAWQTAWAKIMADLISGSGYPALSRKIPGSADVLPIFVSLDKGLPGGDRATPWEQLHHEGYWLDLASKSTSARRAWALEIPEEDRHPPNRSPASIVASKAHLYDTYLAMEPYREVPIDGSAGYDYAAEIISTLDAAIEHFSRRGQLRKIEALELRKALEHIETRAWKAAIDILRPLWESRNWRRGGWWKLLQQLGWALLDCLSHLKDSELLLQVLWELSSDVFERKPGIEYDLRRAVAGLGSENIRPSVAVDTDAALSPIVPSFAFSTHNVFVGESVECQLCLHSRAQSWLSPIRLSEVKVVFEGSLKPLYLVAEEGQVPDDESSDGAVFVDVSVQESSMTGNKRSSAGAIASQSGSANLTISSSQVKIFRVRVIPREAGDVSVASITLLINDEHYSLAVTTSDFGHSVAQWWEARGGVPTARFLGQESNAYNSINVQPKPPKLQIEAAGLKGSYYTNESIQIDIDIVNEEDEDAIVTIESRMISPVADAARVRWLDSATKYATVSGTGILTLPHRDLGTVASSGRTTFSLCIDDTVIAVDHELAIVAKYGLISEPETLLTKSLTLDIGVIRPFEANYDFVPCLHTGSWPSFFNPPPPNASSSTPVGLKHQYSMAANICSFATEPIAIDAILLTATRVVGGAVCSASTGMLRNAGEGNATAESASISSVILPDQTETFDFELMIQKLALDDRHTVTVDLALEIGWHRQDSEHVNSTILEVPKLVALMAEPRVLLTTSPVPLGRRDVSLHALEFMLENPSMHFLTFNLSMEASEDFALSGPKVCALSLVPISRHAVTYRILPNKRDQWIAVHLTVVDAYFGQTLKVMPGGEGVKVDKNGQVFVRV